MIDGVLIEKSQMINYLHEHKQNRIS